MGHMQAQLDKIRSDAAECRLLSTLASSEKREMFVAMAEHLNGLAVEIEKSIAAGGDAPRTLSADADRPATENQATVAADPPAAEPRRSHGRRVLPWLLVIVAAIIAGASFWAKPIQQYYLSMSHARPAGPQAAVARRDDLPATGIVNPGNQQPAMRDMQDRLSAMADRVDKLERQVTDFRKAQLATTTGTAKAAPAAAADRPADSAASKPTAPEEFSSPLTTNSISQQQGSSPPAAPENSALARNSEAPSSAEAKGSAEDEVASTQPDNVSNANGGAARSEANAAAARPDHHRHRVAIGPPGCRHFRSYDAASGTYLDFDRRRRRCR
jgi:hypothetical protein